MGTDDRTATTEGRGNHSPAKIVFLLYYSRSGSTFLSSRLDRYEDVGVTVESNFIRVLLENRKALHQASGPKEAYELIKDEGRIRNLEVSEGNFSTHLRKGGGYTVEEVTRALLAAYFADKKPLADAWVVKDGANGYWINQLAKEIPGAYFVHVIRDGRAVLNSGLKAVKPYGKGERMVRDPLTAARTWTRFVNNVDEYGAKNPDQYTECRYEDLMIDEDRQITRLRSFFGLGEGGRAADTFDSYYSRIPDREKAIHGLVYSAASTERVEAWREELQRGNQLVFQYRAFSTLKKHGYEVTEESLTRLLRDPDFVVTCLSSIALRLRSWVSLLLDPRKLRYILETKTLYRRDGKP